MIKIYLTLLISCLPWCLSAQNISLNWANATGGFTIDHSTDMVAAASGTVFTLGFFNNTVDFDPDVSVFNVTAVGTNDLFISSFSQGGSFNWVKTWNGVLTGQSLTHDPSGGIIFTGHFNGTIDFDPGPGVLNMTSLGQYDIFIVKLSGNGNLVWARQVGGVYSDYGNCISTDAAGNVYTTGQYSSNVDFDPGPGVYYLSAPSGSHNTYVSKLNSSGNFVWALHFDAQTGAGAANSSSGRTIKIDGSGNIIVSGHYSGTVDFDPGIGTTSMTTSGLGNEDIYFVKLSSLGNLAWAKGVNGPVIESLNAMSTDSQGHVIAAGHFNGTTDFDPGAGVYNLTSTGANDVYIMKLDAAGSFGWAVKIGGVNSENCNDLVVDPAGNVIVAGDFIGMTDFDPGAGSYLMSGNGNIESYLLKVSGSGNFIWATHWGGSGNAESTVYAISLDGNGKLYSSGTFYETCDFNPGPGTYNLTPNGLTDIFQTSFNQCVNTTATLSPSSCNTYTSPSGNYTWITSGTYSDTIANASGCDSILTINLTIIPFPTGITGTTSFCQGASTVLNAGPGYTGYLWSTGALTQSINVSLAGTYTVTVTNGVCTDSTSVVVTVLALPVPIITGVNVVCQGQTTTFCATGAFATYIWSTGAASQCITIGTAGTYTVTVIDNNGCTNSTSRTLTVNPNPVPSITGPSVTCQGSCVTLNGGAGYTFYVWSTGSTTQTIQACVSGTYFITVADPNGCTGSDSVTVTVNPAPLPQITGDTAICSGQSATLDAGGPYTGYVWSNGSITQTIVVTVPGIYTVTVTDANGCTGSDLITVSQAPPYSSTLSVSGSLQLCVGDSVQLSLQAPMSSYQWYKNNIVIPGATGPFFWASQSGRYKCESVDISNCNAVSNQARVAVVCHPPQPPSEKAEVPLTNPLNAIISPNPVMEQFTIYFNRETDQPYVVTLADLTGKTVYRSEARKNACEINIRGMRGGYYLVEILFSDGTRLRKPIIVL